MTPSEIDSVRRIINEKWPRCKWGEGEWEDFGEGLKNIPVEVEQARAALSYLKRTSDRYPTVAGLLKSIQGASQVKKSAGAVSKTFGIPDVTGSMTLMIPATGFGNLLSLTDFTISYPWGGSKYLIQHCSWNEDDRSANPAAGDSTLTLNFTGTAETSI